MSATTEQRERSHETILSSASRLFREKGIAGPRVEEVMRGRGSPWAASRRIFPTKEALIAEAFERAGREMRERMLTGLDAKPGADRAEIPLKRNLSAAHRDQVGEGCPLPAVNGEVATSAPQTARCSKNSSSCSLARSSRALPRVKPSRRA